MSPKYPWLDLDLTSAAARAAEEQGISEQARSPEGFFPAYLRSGGDPDSMGFHKSGQSWISRRDGFVARHLTQVIQRHEPLWKGGIPTGRHLALAVWAFSPDEEELREWLDDNGYFSVKNPYFPFKAKVKDRSVQGLYEAQNRLRASQQLDDAGFTSIELGDEEPFQKKRIGNHVILTSPQAAVTYKKMLENPKKVDSWDLFRAAREDLILMDTPESKTELMRRAQKKGRRT
jgi:hypothetical protein